MARHGGQVGVFVKLTTTAGCWARIESKLEDEVMSVKGVPEAGGVGEGVGTAVAEDATALKSEEPKALGVAEPDAGGVGRPACPCDWPGAGVFGWFTGCSVGAVFLNIASICGRMACPNGVERNSAGRPIISTVLPTAQARIEMLTADPRWNRCSREEPNDIRREMVTVEFDEMVGVWRVHFLQRRNVLVERCLINFSTTTIDLLHWRSVVGGTWARFKDPLTEEYLSAICDNRGVPVNQCCSVTMSSVPKTNSDLVNSPDPVNLFAGEHH